MHGGEVAAEWWKTKTSMITSCMDLGYNILVGSIEARKCMRRVESKMILQELGVCETLSSIARCAWLTVADHQLCDTAFLSNIGCVKFGAWFCIIDLYANQ